MTTLYAAQGIPIGFFVVALAAWLASEGAPPNSIAAIVASAFAPWGFKFVIAPLIDRYGFRPMGRWRPWLIGSQSLMLAGFIAGAAMAPGASDTNIYAWLAFVVFLGSAVQDVAVDGLAVDILSPDEQGTANSLMAGGQTLGVAFGGALSGTLLDLYGARAAFLALLPIYAAIVPLVLLVRETPHDRIWPWSADECPSLGDGEQSEGWKSLAKAVAVAMIGRDSLLLVTASTAARAVAGAFAAFWPVFATTEGGYSASTYSSLVGIIGVICPVACMWIGVVLLRHSGSRRGAMICYSGYALLALICLVGIPAASMALFVTALAFWYTIETLASASVNALRMQLCDKRAAATQFTAYTSFGNLAAALGAGLFAWFSGLDRADWLMAVLAVLSVASCAIFALMNAESRLDCLKALHMTRDGR